LPDRWSPAGQAAIETRTPIRMATDVLLAQRSLDVTDEQCASASDCRVLITGASSDLAEALGRRLHLASRRASRPIVRTRAIALPADPNLLRDRCAALLDASAGGTLLISDVEHMVPAVQHVVIHVFETLALDRPPVAAVRFIFTTTVSLHDRIAAGFSERLFYHLNTIHLRAPGTPGPGFVES
jgi:DNA-binding NtrC family response regulator